MARILDVNQFSADARGQNWRSVVQIFADEERFHEAYDVASYANVVKFVADRENAASSCHRSGRPRRTHAVSVR